MLQSQYIITHHNTGMQGSEIILLLKIVQIILLSSPPGQIRPARVRPAPLGPARSQSAFQPHAAPISKRHMHQRTSTAALIVHPTIKNGGLRRTCITQIPTAESSCTIKTTGYAAHASANIHSKSSCTIKTTGYAAHAYANINGESSCTILCPTARPCMSAGISRSYCFPAPPSASAHPIASSSLSIP